MSTCVAGGPHCSRGFTLIEVVFVVVILGIVASIGSHFMVSAVEGYRVTQTRVQLANRGRVALEQMARQLRLAVPNSVRVSDTGNCVEFMPVVAASHYRSQLPDAENALPDTSSIKAAAFSVGFGTPAHAVVAPFYGSELYTSASPSARAALGALGESPITEVPLANSHRFIRNSISHRVFLAADPLRFCLSGGQLLTFFDYGVIGGALPDSDPGGRSAVMADQVSAASRAFTLFPGSEVRNAAVTIDIRFGNNGEQLSLTQEVFVRNVP